MTDRHLSRGKRTDNNEWAIGAYHTDYPNTERHMIISHDTGGEHGGLRYDTVDPATVGLCTGLPDKNGKLIYEGDILRVRADEEEPETYRVAFENYSWEMKSPIYDYQELRDFVNDYTTLEIIGNVFDNPELLTQEV